MGEAEAIIMAVSTHTQRLVKTPGKTKNFIRSACYRKINGSFLGAGVNNIYIKIEILMINLTTNSGICFRTEVERKGN